MKFILFEKKNFNVSNTGYKSLIPDAYVAIRPGGLFAQHSPSFSDMSGNMPHDQNHELHL